MEKLENLKSEFNLWVEAENTEFRERYSDRFPACHPDWLAVRVPKKFYLLFSELEPEIINRGNYLTEGLWFFPDSGEILMLSYQN